MGEGEISKKICPFLSSAYDQELCHESLCALWIRVGREGACALKIIALKAVGVLS